MYGKNETKYISVKTRKLTLVGKLQASASALLSSLEKEKELLKIFLKVSQMENSTLRRMNLSSFLMVSENSENACRKSTGKDLTYQRAKHTKQRFKIHVTPLIEPKVEGRLKVVGGQQATC